jgi:hypothetical protein
VPRLFAALGFKPALLIQDSFSYLQEGTHLSTGQLRPAGYPMFLWVIGPFHSLLLVTTLQHLMGIATGALVYWLLRSRGLPAWGATLAAAPTLFDSRQIWQESAILPDTLFTFVIIVAAAILLTKRPLTMWSAVIVGLLISWASVIRGNGAPIFVIVLAFLLVRRVGWRVLTACVAAFALPLLGYMLLFFADYGQFNITNSTGIFLWSRTMSFANCSVIKPPADLAALCPDRQPGHPTGPAPAWSLSALLSERSPASYLWAPGSWYQTDAHPGINAYNNGLATKFAIKAIEAQPVAYLQTVGEGVLLTFLATDRSESFLSLHFTATPHISALSGYQVSDLHMYAHTTRNTYTVQPWAFLTLAYQLPVFFPGVVFFLVLAVGLVGLIRRWRGVGAFAGLAWGIAAVNIVIPVAMHELDYRYAISAVPFACLAAGLVFIRKRPAEPASLTRDSGALANGAVTDRALTDGAPGNGALGNGPLGADAASPDVQ